MGEMNIKLKDETLIGRISDLAKQHHRTLEGEVESLLREAVSKPFSVAERVRRAQEIADMTPMDRPQTDSAIMLREDRDR